MRSIAVACALSWAASAYATPLAVTIDDLPWVGGTRPGETRDQATVRLVATLTDRKVPATAFVVCEGNGPLDVLPRWVEAGIPLGNHTANHLDLAVTPPEAWLADVWRCQDELVARGATASWFRFPYLSSGTTPAIRDEVAAALAARGLRDAPVTIDTSDWVLGAAYDAALQAGDAEAQARIAPEYTAHLLRAAAHYREVAQTRVGRDVPQVLLLHANALAADHLGEALDALHEAGFEFASLDAVMADPVYALPDQWAGPVGMSWLYRIATPHGHPWDLAEREALRRLVAPGGRASGVR